MRNVDWSPRDPRDFVEDKLTVTITLMEYRELVSKAALYDVIYAGEQEEKDPPPPARWRRPVPMPSQTSRPAAESRAVARAMWRAGYSVRYIARSPGVGERTAEKLIGRDAIRQRESWRYLRHADK